MGAKTSQSRFATCMVGFPMAASMLVTGCGGAFSSNEHQVTDEFPTNLQGRVMGGQSAVVGASIQLYAAGATGYGAGAQALLSPAITSGQDGSFDITTSDYTCPAGNPETYIVATGGDPGTGQTNSAIALMAALGTCSGLTSVSFVDVNEVTTVASVWALAQFMGYGAQMGTSSTNAQGITNAFANVNNAVNIENGTSPGLQPPTGASVPTARINTLANILAACVNSTGASTCNSLFGYATPSGGTAPTNTLDAALDIAWNPSNNAASLFSLVAAQPPFEPSLSTAPKDWLIAVSFNGGGLNYPTAIAVDATGDVWAANYCGSDSPCSSVTELSNSGQTKSPSTGFTDGSFWESYGLTIDINGNVWVTNQQTASVNSGSGGVSELSSSGAVISPAGGYYGGGVYFPVAVSSDTDGNIWIANLGSDTASKLNNSGSAISGSGGFGAAELAGPCAVALDENNNAWFADQYAGTGSTTSISSSGSQADEITSGGYQPCGVAIDKIGVSSGSSQGHVWIANYSTNDSSIPGSVSELTLNNNGSTTVTSSGYYSVGGLDHPNGIAIDGAGHVWVTNYQGNTLTELIGSYSASQGDAISPAQGFGENADLSSPFGVAVDSSGNVWVSNYGASTITQFLGAATPVKTPLVGPPQVP